MTSPPAAEAAIARLPRPARNSGPGQEPQSVRDAWDAHLTGQHQHEPEPEPEAEAS